MKQKKYICFHFYKFFSSITTAVLGGTHQMNDYNTAVNESDTKFIYEGCAQMIPSIKHAKIIDEMVGLRPGRTYVRLEQDTYTASKIKYTQTYLLHKF